MVNIFKFNQYLIKENKLTQKLNPNSLEECEIKRRKFPIDNFTTQEVIEIKKILDEDTNLKYTIDKNILDISKVCIVEKLEDEWFIFKAGSFTHTEDFYIIDGFDDIKELLKLFPFTFSILKLFRSSEYDDKIEKSIIFHTLLNTKSTLYDKLKVILLVLNSKLLNDNDVGELLSTKCRDILLLSRELNKIYTNNKNILANLETCLDILKNNY